MIIQYTLYRIRYFFFFGNNRLNVRNTTGIRDNNIGTRVCVWNGILNLRFPVNRINKNISTILTEPMWYTVEYKIKKFPRPRGYFLIIFTLAWNFYKLYELRYSANTQRGNIDFTFLLSIYALCCYSDHVNTKFHFSYVCVRMERCT